MGIKESHGKCGRKENGGLDELILTELINFDYVLGGLEVVWK